MLSTKGLHKCKNINNNKTKHLIHAQEKLINYTEKGCNAAVIFQFKSPTLKNNLIDRMCKTVF